MERTGSSDRTRMLQAAAKLEAKGYPTIRAMVKARPKFHSRAECEHYFSLVREYKQQGSRS